MMTTTISTLPGDLLEEIISRVPLKLMKAVKLTCQRWNNLSKRDSFTKLHVEKATTREGEEAMVIMKMRNDIYLMSVVVDQVHPSIELKGRLSQNQVCLSKVYHYEGLLLCILKEDSKIVVWNPYLGQTRSIHLRCSHWNFEYAFGYEEKESRRSLKILRFIDYFFKTSERQFYWYELYDFDSGEWTTLDVTPRWGIYWSTGSVSLKGNAYWCANERSSIGPENNIICFDFTRERFGPLLPLPPVTNYDYGRATLSCVKEEKLAALFETYGSYEYEFEIWITTKIETEMVSWSMFLRMDTRPNILGPDSYFIDEEKKVFMAFDREIDYDLENPNTYINIIGEARRLRKMDIRDLGVELNCWPNVCFYVPSLVEIKEPAQGKGKRKRQSSTEKRLFDQNKLRLDAIENLLKWHY